MSPRFFPSARVPAREASARSRCDPWSLSFAAAWPHGIAGLVLWSSLACEARTLPASPHAPPCVSWQTSAGRSAPSAPLAGRLLVDVTRQAAAPAVLSPTQPNDCVTPRAGLCDAENHLLYTLLPDKNSHGYNLRHRRHDRTLASNHHQRNFIDRQLHKQSY